jgi:hypothetical protein
MEPDFGYSCRVNPGNLFFRKFVLERQPIVMEQIIITLKDQSKRKLLLELLAEFDFLEFQIVRVFEDEAREDAYDFFQSAGLFKGRAANADQLRKEAWRSNR